MSDRVRRIGVIDSHTGGEPTRVVVAGGPDLGRGDLAERRAIFRDHFDDFRSAVVNEPRGSDAMVGALLCEPTDPSCAAGVIFFNNVGYLGMCGHGTIGLLVTLAHLGRIGPARTGSRRPSGSSRPPSTAQRGDRPQRPELPARQGRRAVERRGASGTGRRATSPGAATGSSWSRITARRSSLANLERLTDFTVEDPPGADRAGDHRRERRRDRPHRAVRPALDDRRRQQELRPLPRQGLRPLALRHRHQRQARLPGRRRQAQGRRDLAAGEHHRQRLRGVRDLRRTAGPSPTSRARPTSTPRPR